ncbi:MAG: hypothetical protein RR561_01310 [Peptostreptococcus sp.]|uniref:hypothetical protein n=1 Tax=Peptostreptococcus sp. TaxID=1262 RepID=UPI002FCC44EF
MDTKKNGKFKMNKYARIDSQSIFEAKQRIAIEKYGDIFEDQIFFELELALNDELADELNKEYNERFNLGRILN